MRACAGGGGTPVAPQGGAVFPPGTGVVVDDGGTISVVSRLLPGTSLHFYRLTDAPYTDLGSSPVNLTATGASWVGNVSGPYILFDGSAQTAPANGGDRLSAVVSDIPAASDFTVGCTLACDNPRSGLPINGALLFGVGDGVAFGPGTGTFFTVQSNGGGTQVFLSTAINGVNVNSGNVSIDWTRRHRLSITYADGTKTTTLYIDGIAVTSVVTGVVSVPALTEISYGGFSTYASIATSASKLIGEDLNVHLTAFSAAEEADEYNTCRRMM